MSEARVIDLMEALKRSLAERTGAQRLETPPGEPRCGTDGHNATEGVTARAPWVPRRYRRAEKPEPKGQAKLW